MCIKNTKRSLHIIEPTIRNRGTDIHDSCQNPEPDESNPSLPKLFFLINLNIILPSTPRLSMQIRTFRLSIKDPVYLSLLLQAFHIPRPSHPPLHNHPQAQSKNLPSSKLCLRRLGMQQWRLETGTKFHKSTCIKTISKARNRCRDKIKKRTLTYTVKKNRLVLTKVALKVQVR